ncbi:Uncharacterised protein [Mycobacteroides abscessus subsp. abscessus]|uniref:hypothetical protein n=2 Tax=Mycobacteroides abscessus TaxID=36809 RepID=UPI0005E605D4|nr:hypothetical protein [Mycobacteroides abscessus]MDO3010115.1 hypothetical protein [Mycobacteroides abscessus subsp. abscessus]MDO3043126.1 hypothetical protein [Mycobacteroides abscessus subsp. abscessus]MDO3139071.1 hypothetical protein [Mycobacteroides abscessus subsp. abscessus]MDO3152713.1 hypothetical protein [Mycobacteroides abscessus subsp. abscessus]CPS15591.1 Uncharacterised protein [Mycobacteroides abscessus]
MSTTHDIQKPDDQFGLVGDNWPVESESAYATAERQATTASNTAQAQAQEATDAATKTDADMKGKTAESVSNGYSHSASQLHEQSVHYNTVSAWMADAGGAVAGAKRRISTLVRAGTSEIRDAITSETTGTAVSPSSSELTTKYQGDIATIASKLGVDLASIGHSLSGDSGASTTPAYVRTGPTSTAPTIREAAHQEASGQAPELAPHQLPPMPRASAPSSTDSPSVPGTPSVPSAPAHPTLAGLISGSGPSGTPNSPSTSSKPASSATSGAPAVQQQAHQSTEQHQYPKEPGLPHIPSLPLPDIAAAAETIATAVSSATAHQLSTAAPSTITPSTPASTGITPGVPGTPPMTPMAPGLSPIGGGGLSTPAVTQPTTPAVQGTPVAPSPAPQQTTTPSPPRGPVVDTAWLQRNYGLAPGLDLPKPETPIVSALFIAELPDSEAHLHRALGTLRQEFERSGWSQPLAVATLRRGFETRTVYVTSDSVSVHPHGVLLPAGLTPLDEMPGTPVDSRLEGSLMVSEKLKALIPYGWEVQSMLSTVPADEHHQSTEQYQALVRGGELLECKVSRGREGVEAGEAMSVFARVAIGSGGCGELDVEGARLRAARWVGVQPSGYQGLLARWYLSDAADSMSRGAWGEAVYSSEKYLGVMQPRSQAA